MCPLISLSLIRLEVCYFILNFDQSIISCINPFCFLPNWLISLLFFFFFTKIFSVLLGLFYFLSSLYECKDNIFSYSFKIRYVLLIRDSTIHKFLMQCSLSYFIMDTCHKRGTESQNTAEPSPSSSHSIPLAIIKEAQKQNINGKGKKRSWQNFHSWSLGHGWGLQWKKKRINKGMQDGTTRLDLWIQER